MPLLDDSSSTRTLTATPGELWRLNFERPIGKFASIHRNTVGAWVSDSVGWVIPTAGAILALERGRRLGLIRDKEVAVACPIVLGLWNAPGTFVQTNSNAHSD